MSASDDPHLRLVAASHPRRARGEDAAPLARLFAAAFASDPVFDWIVRRGSRRAEGLERFFYWLLRMRIIPFGEVWTAQDGAVAAAWLPADVVVTSGGLMEQLRLLPVFLRLCGIPRLARASAVADAIERHQPQERHLYLAFIAVAPRLQGMGLGSAMLEATLKRADQTGLPAYLENSNPRNTPLYVRHGFIRQRNIAPAGAPPLVSMRRAGHKPALSGSR